MRNIRLETGDITFKPPRQRVFTISVPDAAAPVELTFDNATAHVAAGNWPSLIRQVKTRSLTKWKFSQMDPPIGEPDFQRLLVEVSNTPSYQLFLAGFDIAQVVGLVGDLDDQVVLSRCLSLARRIPAPVGPKGLFFVPDVLVANAAPAAIQSLVLGNKLCRMSAQIGTFTPVTKYYIPYVTPIHIVKDDQTGVEELWGHIRDYYYAFR